MASKLILSCSLWSGVRLSPTVLQPQICLLYQAFTIDKLDHCWNDNLQGKIHVLRGKFCPIATSSIILPQGLSWNRTQPVWCEANPLDQSRSIFWLTFSCYKDAYDCYCPLPLKFVKQESLLWFMLKLNPLLLDCKLCTTSSGGIDPLWLKTLVIWSTVTVCKTMKMQRTCLWKSSNFQFLP